MAELGELEAVEAVEVGQVQVTQEPPAPMEVSLLVAREAALAHCRVQAGAAQMSMAAAWMVPLRAAAVGAMVGALRAPEMARRE